MDVPEPSSPATVPLAPPRDPPPSPPSGLLSARTPHNSVTADVLNEVIAASVSPKVRAAAPLLSHQGGLNAEGLEANASPIGMVEGVSEMGTVPTVEMADGTTEMDMAEGVQEV